MKHTTFYIYDKTIYGRIQAIAKLQGKTTVKFIWDELVARMEEKYTKDTLAQFLVGADVVNPPNVREPIKDQKTKFTKMPLSALREYDKDLATHVKIFKNELRSKKNE